MPRTCMCALAVAAFAVVAMTLVFAQDTPAAPAAPVTSTGSAIAAASTGSALAGEGTSTASDMAIPTGMTSQDVMKKAADAYKRMTSYYEESTLSSKIEIPGSPAREETTRIVASFKRPATFKTEMTNPYGTDVAFFDKGVLISYLGSDKKYTKQACPNLEDIAALMPLPLFATALAQDPYYYMIMNATKIEPLKTADFQGRRAYQVDIRQGEGKTVTYYFDMEKFYLVGATAEAEVYIPMGEATTDPQAEMPTAKGKGYLTAAAQKVLIDELPKDAQGKDMDVFTFTLPPDASEVKIPEAGAPQATDLSSTGSDAAPAGAK